MVAAIAAGPMKTTSSSASFVPAVRSSGHGLFRAVSLLVTTGALAATVFAQAPATPDAEGRGRRRGGDATGNGNNNGGGRGNFDLAAMQEQQMARMKEAFAVTDDAEWALISERVTKVNEIRRTAGGGRGGFGGGGPGGPGGAGGDRGGGGNRQARPTGNPELDSLRSAVTDKLPDAEIKSRLSRLREVRKENEEKLTKAQEDLRAVLSVRQEAIAVMFGLLP